MTENSPEPAVTLPAASPPAASPPAANLPAASPPADRNFDDFGGDPVCWAPRVCPDCGLFVPKEPPTQCPRCGAMVGVD